MGRCQRRWQAKAAPAQAGGQFSERRALGLSDSHGPHGAWPTPRPQLTRAKLHTHSSASRFVVIDLVE